MILDGYNIIIIIVPNILSISILNIIQIVTEKCSQFYALLCNIICMKLIIVENFYIMKKIMISEINKVYMRLYNKVNSCTTN